MKPADRKALGISLPAETIKHAAYREEKELQRLCEQELSRRGIVYLHLSPRAREKAGWPDLTFALEGRAVAVELKSAAGRLRPEQEALLSRMIATGWLVRIVRSLDELRNVLNNTNPHWQDRDAVAEGVDYGMQRRHVQ